MNLEDLFEGSLSLSGEKSTDALAGLPTCRGVLLFTDPAGQPVRLTYCANLRRTAQAKLQSHPEEPTRRADLSVVTAGICYQPCRTEYESFRQYIRLAHAVFSDSTEEMISLPPAHCVYADPQERWGAFTCSDQPLQKSAAVYFGLFSSRRHADAFAQAWNTVFGLCRNRRLALAGRGRQCSYYQMGLCPGPCMDQTNETMYRRSLEQAIEAASDAPEKMIDLLTIEMKHKAANMEFEQAQLLKKQVDQLQDLTHSAYRWTSNLRDLRIVHIDRSGFSRKAGRKKVPVFCVYEMDAHEAVMRKEITIDSETPISDLAENQNLSPLAVKEHLGLLSYYLYRSSPPGLWMRQEECESKTPEDFQLQIAERFLKRKGEEPSPDNEEECG